MTRQLTDKEFEMMCHVQDQRATSGKCTMDSLADKFGKAGVLTLIDDGLLSKSQYGMVVWTYDGTRSMGPEFVRNHIAKQVGREMGNLKQ